MQNQDLGSNKDPSAIIDLLMKNPELIKMFASALTKDSSPTKNKTNDSVSVDSQDSEDAEANTTTKSASSNNSNPLGDLGSQLPLIMSLLGPVMQGMGKNDSQGADINTTAKSANVNNSNPLGDLGSQLPLIMSLLGPMMQGMGKGDTQGASHQIAGLLPLSKATDKNTALLLSLKPFLSEEKSEIINYLVTFEKISGMLKDMK